MWLKIRESFALLLYLQRLPSSPALKAHDIGVLLGSGKSPRVRYPSRLKNTSRLTEAAISFITCQRGVPREKEISRLYDIPVYGNANLVTLAFAPRARMTVSIGVPDANATL